jgi:hypothetical protein
LSSIVVVMHVIEITKEGDSKNPVVTADDKCKCAGIAVELNHVFVVSQIEPVGASELYRDRRKTRRL